jgi:hypothetical protein
MPRKERKKRNEKRRYALDSRAFKR